MPCTLARALAAAAVGVGLLNGCTTGALFPVRTQAASQYADRLNQAFRSDSGQVRYHLFPAANARGLIVQFHGDGAYEFDHPQSDYSLGGPRGIVAVARSHGYATLVIRTPDDDTDTWWKKGRANVPVAMDLINRTKKDLGLTETWLVGYSGGSQFITQYLLPTHPELMASGGAVMFGGGGAPRRDITLPADAAKGYPMTWYTGAEDDGTKSEDGYDARDDAVRGRRWYEAHAARTRAESPAGVSHDLTGRFGPILDGLLPKR
ncbi:hypothetical protein [Nigerium massiliense]|uniref:hypothetical protein n=1 Tax=Nigerium massiliense TaxID=1522317 RepID=UPI000694E4B9|nr:hypothetical protein [Nigerium massiliense]